MSVRDLIKLAFNAKEYAYSPIQTLKWERPSRK